MLNPFDLKAALTAKHAQHVVLIHFPIALFIAGAAFDFASHWTKRQSLAAAAYFNFLVAAATSVPTMITGLLAWQWQLEGQRLRGALLLHLIFGVASGTLICVVWLIHWGARRAEDEKLRVFCLPLEALTAVLLAVTGHLGGFLSGVNVPGQKSSPLVQECIVNGGFLGSQAPLTADVVLLLELAMGAGLLAGAWLARAKRFRQHAWCQSSIVLLNLVIIALIMAPSFRTQVVPRIPAKLSRSYFALATAHAALGTITELAALYILLAAGTRLLPESLRLKRYKLWMRSVLGLWWLVLLLGFATYVRWYVPKFSSLGFGVKKQSQG